MVTTGSGGNDRFHDPDTIFLSKTVRETLIRTPEPTRKILATTGDSFTEGDYIPKDFSYPNVLQRLLGQEFYDFRVDNLGVGGFGADQSFRLFQKYL